MKHKTIDYYLSLERFGTPRRGANLRLPADLRQPEADRLKAFIDALVFTQADLSESPALKPSGDAP